MTGKEASEREGGSKATAATHARAGGGRGLHASHQALHFLDQLLREDAQRVVLVKGLVGAVHQELHVCARPSATKGEGGWGWGG